MTHVQSILNDPLKRTNSTYRFKVTAIQGNTIHYHDAAMQTNTQELPNDSEQSLEQQYQDKIDNLFIAIDHAGNYYFTSKLSNSARWPGFS